MTTAPASLAPSHRRGLTGVVLLVLVLHAGLLSQSELAWAPNADKPNPTNAFVTRQIVLPAPATPRAPRATQHSGPESAATQATNETQPSPHPPASTQTPHQAHAQASPQAAPQPALPLDPLHPNLTAPVALPQRAASAVDLPPFQRNTPEGQSEPTTAQAPASATLGYAVQGLAKGFHYNATATLLWKNEAGRYSASLEVGMLLLGKRTQTSSGLVGPEGLMPERFSDKNRSELAAHFQRDKGLISFSANTPEVPLLKGAQDRLSIVLQLGALLAGDPARYPLGTMLSFQTVSQREAEVWQFKVVEVETLQLPYGDVPSIKLQRNPRREFDQRIELWLAPSLGYLPVRLRITNANGEWVDQLLRSVEKNTPDSPTTGP